MKRYQVNTIKTISAVFMTMMIAHPALAVDDLSKATQNPIADLDSPSPQLQFQFPK